MGHRDDGRDERHDRRVFQHGDDEGAVDLERVYRELGEVTERGIAGAEVVDRDAQSEHAHRLQLLHVRLDVLHDEALRDLDVYSGRDRPEPDRFLDGGDEIAPAQLDGRHVYRYARRGQPALL